jgi:hypothetical protein
MADMFSSGVSGLLAFQNALTTTGHNISNVATPGYSRQRVELGTRPAEMQGDFYIGMGVNSQTVRRSYDQLLTEQVRSTGSAAAQMDRYATFATRLDNLLGAQGTSVSPMLSQFFNDLELLAENPAGIPERQVVLTDADLLAAIGAEESHAEGLFFPDTYYFSPHSPDIEVLRRAYQLQREKLLAAWESRAPGLPYKTPYEALIMASIIEKETGAAEERPQIAAVFVNRLNRGMRLQTDPTVIYGLGTRFDGNLRKADLLRDTPYNTYTRAGLPPTPIAMPGEEAIRAALNPADSKALYFVARGDGTHVFSDTLEEHNRAVNRFQRKQN